MDPPGNDLRNPGIWDGLDECEISRPEIVSQSAPAYTCPYLKSTYSV